MARLNLCHFGAKGHYLKQLLQNLLLAGVSTVSEDSYNKEDKWGSIYDTTNSYSLDMPENQYPIGCSSKNRITRYKENIKLLKKKKITTQGCMKLGPHIGH